MNIHAFLHVSFEGLGEIESWIQARGHRLTCKRFFQGEPPPDETAVDWLIVMGGPLNVYEYRNHPWLRGEKRFIERFMHTGKQLLGICLGAQLIADVSGAKVYQNAEKEIGWWPVSFLPAAASLLGSTDSPLEVFHWHGDTFDLPAGATRWAESEGCANQAFSYGENVTALQFHPEMTASGVAALAEHGLSDLTPGRFVQDIGSILSRRPHESLAVLHRMLDRIAERADASPGMKITAE